MDNVRSANAEWTWFHSGIQQVRMHTIEDPAVKAWAEETLHNQHNYISTVSLKEEERRRLNGTIVFFPKPYNPEIKQFMHYYVTGDKLVTIGLPPLLYDKMGQEAFEEQLLSWSNPVEAFIYIANLILEHYFDWMDQFELKLMKAKISMRNSNGGHLFRYIMDLRFNLIQSGDQMTPLKEIRYAAMEVFGNKVNESHVFNVLQHRMKRAQMLQSGYKSEIDSLLKLDDATINYRSNDIIKTLTVFTVLLTPMSALGAIWGMNFEHMYEIEWEWGYPAALLLMFTSMGAIYWYLKKQGWTGNILDTKNMPRKEQ
jgi:magnesium transporter